MKKFLNSAFEILKIAVGSGLFALGFNLFLIPNDLNAGGLTGLAMVAVRLLNLGSVGAFTALMNLPLFALAGLKVGKKFFKGSLIGMLFSAVFLDLFSTLPVPQTEPLIGALYGGAICGVGLGIVFMSGASTGGSDIVIRLLKLRYQSVPIGTISICFDGCVVALTAIIFRSVSVALYSGVALFVSGQIVDAVVYRFDYSKVALIITQKHELMASEIERRLDRGATFLHAEGSFSRQNRMVVLTAVKRHQVADLKQLAMEIDPAAFVIVQEAHQVLGDGFSKYSRDAL